MSQSVFGGRRNLWELLYALLPYQIASLSNAKKRYDNKTKTRIPIAVWSENEFELLL